MTEIDGSDSRETGASPISPPIVEATLLPQPAELSHGTALAELHDAPGFLHPSSIFFEAAAQLRHYIIPAALGLAGAASGNSWGLSVAMFVFCLTVLFNLVRYLTLKYKIQDNELVVTEGLLFRRIRSVPIRRIQNIDFVQNVLHRIFDVAVVKIETASGSKPEATLRVITMAQVQQLRRAVFAQDAQAAQPLTEPPAGSLPAGEPGTASPLAVPLATRQAAAEPKILWRIPSRLLFLAGLTSNRGLVLIGIAAGFFFQGDWTGDWQPQRISPDDFTQYVPAEVQSLDIFVQVGLGVLCLLILLRVVSVGWYFLRFYGYQLSLHGEDLRISCGLFTKVNATVPRDRIQFISIHRPLLMRPLGLATVRIETAGGGGNQNEDASATVSRRWFVPVIDAQAAMNLLPLLRPSIAWDEAQINWRGLAPRAGQRMLRQGIVLSLLAAIIGLAATQPWGFLAGLAVLPLAVLLSRKKAKARRYARTPWGIVFQSGILTKKLSISFLDRLQTVDYSQTFFDRRWNMATLRVDTAAAGPADHLIDIAYLDAGVALSEYDYLRVEAACQKPAFG